VERLADFEKPNQGQAGPNSQEATGTGPFQVISGGNGNAEQPAA
jgi:hypothetical protein